MSTSLAYTLTAEIEVDGVVQSGSAVQSMIVEGTDTTFPDQTRLEADWYGEAIAVPLPDGGAIFIPMETARAGGGYGVALLGGCGIVRPFGVGVEAVEAVAAFRGTCDIDTKTIPLVVFLPNASDPSQMIDASDLPNVRVRRLSLTLADRLDEPKIRETYPWLATDNRFIVQSVAGPFTVFASAFVKKLRQ
jgi:hypothetical protein